jgi:hypothetical protein
MKLLARSEEYVLLAVWRLKDNAYSVSILEQVSRLRNSGKRATYVNTGENPVPSGEGGANCCMNSRTLE